MWKRLLYLIGFARIFLVFFIFKWPLPVAIAELFLDNIDSGVAYKSGMRWPSYTRYDKSIDLWWYLFILIFSFNKIIFPMILVLFIVRFVGQVLTLITRDERYLFWFPNILENYFILYLVVITFSPNLIYYFSGNFIIFPLLLSFISKMPQEYILHMNSPLYGGGKNWSKAMKQALGRQHA